MLSESGRQHNSLILMLRALGFLLILGCISKFADAQPTPSARAAASAEQLLAEDLSTIKNLVVSPDNRHVAYVRKRGDKWEIYLDGDKQSLCDEPVLLEIGAGKGRLATITKVDGKHVVSVAGLDRKFATESPYGSLVFSQDGDHVAFEVQARGKKAVVRDGVIGPEYEDVEGITYSPDGRHLAYVAKTGKAKAVVVDGVVGTAFKDVQEATVLFCPDGKHYAYAAIVSAGIDQKLKTVVIEDGRQIVACSYVVKGTLAFSSDSNHLVFAMSSTILEENCLVVDGKVGPSGSSVIEGQLSISPDGSRTAFASTVDANSSVIADGKRGKPYEDAGKPVFSPDGRSVAYVAEKGGRAYVVLNESPGPGFESIKSPVPTFSPDSKHMAYVAIDGHKQFVVMDGKAGIAFDKVLAATLDFSADSKHFAYIAQAGKACYLVVDGKQGLPFDGHFGNRLSFAAGGIDAVIVRDHKVYRTHFAFQ